MISKFKTFLVAGALIASLPLLSTANNGGGNNGSAPHDKVTLCHNGHLITISRSAVAKHLANHNKSGAKLTCFLKDDPQSPCKGSTKPPKDYPCDPDTGCM